MFICICNNLFVRTNFFSNYIKSNYRSPVSDEHLESILRIGTSHVQPQCNQIKAEKRKCRASREHYVYNLYRIIPSTFKYNVKIIHKKH